RERMAARAHTMDEEVPASRRPARLRTASRMRRAKLPRHGRWPDVLDAAAARGTGDHRPGGGEALAVVGDDGRRCLSRAARVRPCRQGSHFHRLERSAHTGRPRLAARLAAQAGCRALAAEPAMAYAR